MVSNRMSTANADKAGNRRSKLKDFTAFADGLLPHESTYLLRVNQLADPARVDILMRVCENNQRITGFEPYDTRIDKRKYSDLKGWIRKKLASVDVDEQIRYIQATKSAILTDTISPEDEVRLIRKIRHYQHPAFYFGLWYEMLLHYRQFLLIRLRQKDYDLVESFLNTYKSSYSNFQQVQEQVHQATDDVVRQYRARNTESIQWEKWLNQVFYDESQDGFSRYMAFVRLSFISYNYRRIESLWDKFDYLDQQFARGLFYSRRILTNYYHLRLIAHAKVGAYEEAIRYGYFSIRDRNHDFLFYVNNLSAVLLRMGKFEEALSLMRSASPEMKASQNSHNRIGFVSFYMRALLDLGKNQNAVSYGNTFYAAYARDILQERWHTFFAVYLEALFRAGDYSSILQLDRKHGLSEREAEEAKNGNGWPFIRWWVRGASAEDHPGLEKELNRLLNEHLEVAGNRKEEALIRQQIHLLRQKQQARRRP